MLVVVRAGLPLIVISPTRGCGFVAVGVAVVAAVDTVATGAATVCVEVAVGGADCVVSITGCVVVVVVVVVVGAGATLGVADNDAILSK